MATCGSILCRQFWAFIPSETPREALGAAVIKATEEMTQVMVANGYRRAETVEVVEVRCGFMISFHGEPMGWSN